MPSILTPTTELEAVNIILAGAGEQPINSLEEVESSLTIAAIAALTEASRTVQQKGWFWNTESCFELALNDDLECPLPANTLVVNEAWCYGGDDLVQRGSRLYNRTTHSYVYEEGTKIEADLTVALSWDELPEYARAPIFYLAQRRFQMRELTSTAIDNAIQEDVQAAFTQIEQIEDRLGPHNSVAYSKGSGNGLSGRAQVRRR